MNNNPETSEILNLISAPAFAVYNGMITESNDSAKRLMLPTDCPIAALLPQDHQEYANFGNGCLYLTLVCNDTTYTAMVMCAAEKHIFILDTDEEKKALQAFSLTASNLRQPLSDMMATAGNLTAAVEQRGDPKAQEQLLHMNRSMLRMHRILCNMSDALQYAEGTSRHMVCQNIVSVVESIFQQAQTLAEESGLHLEYSLPKEIILCNIDEQLLERGIYNMISNAMKFSPEGSVIQASLFCRDRRIYISIRDQGTGIPGSILNDAFRRYRRQPGLEDGRFGLGLGLVMVRAAARVHGGTVLIDQPDQTGTRITVSIPIRQSGSSLFRTDRALVDYAGGREHALLELSDVLPARLY